MVILELLGSAGQLFMGVLIGGIGVYFKRRLENLASKQDVEKLTDLTEGVKIKHAQGLWLGQQKATLFREDYKLKLDVFLRSIKVLTKYSHAIEQMQILNTWRELYKVSALVFSYKADTKDKMNELYVEYRAKLIAAQAYYDETLLEFGELKALFSVYFDDRFDLRLTDIERKGQLATRQHWDESQFESLLRESLEDACPLDRAHQKVRLQYEAEWTRHMPDADINEFYIGLRKEVKDTRSKMLSDY